LEAEPLPDDALRLKVTVESDGPFALIVQRSGERKVYSIAPGRREFRFPED
jgi:hypothetical protein